MNSRLNVTSLSRPSFSGSRAYFSPIRHVQAFASAARSSATDPLPSRAAREFAERAFVRRWTQPGLLDRAEPVLTRHRD
jgi:hypothetical protein